MRYALISDLHANLEALTAVLSEIDTLGIKNIVCLGDLVGYNTSPNECVEIIRERGIRCIMGNHDSRVAGVETPDDFNYQALEALQWTRGVLTKENANFLKKLPRTLFIDERFLIFHGWLNDTDSYIFGARDAMKNFRLLKRYKKTNLCFFGHTHKSTTYVGMDGAVEINSGKVVKISKKQDYLINPGAVGQPRDRDPRASFAVYDTRESSVTFHKVDYEIQTTVKKIIAAGLSQRLAERLKLGW
jgi:predicted phosphodiesterase